MRIADQMKRSLLWQLYPAVLLIVVAAMVLTYLSVSQSVSAFYRAEKQWDLEARARLIRDRFIEPIRRGDLEEVSRLVRFLGAQTGARITVIDLNGRVIGESEDNPLRMENHLDRPEVQEALKGQTGLSIRPSATLEERMMYVAIPVEDEGRALAVLRTAASIDRLDAALDEELGRIVRAAVAVALILAVVSWLVIWGISRPLREIRRGARRFAEGELGHRLTVPANRELAGLAETMNHMAGELARRIETITAQRNEQQAILSSMAEGVLAIGAGGRCITLNRAAGEMLGVAVGDPVGRSLPEVVRSGDLQQFILEALESDGPTETEVVLPRDGRRRYVQARSTVLTNGRGRRIGAVIVLSDMTEIHRLQTVRTDFVANVSHELKTPVTGIKGFVETLLEGAKDRPQDLQRFLEIIARQADRLNSIIDDLLTLSRIEQQAETAGIALEEAPLKPVLAEAVELCHHRAGQKDIALNLTCDETLRARVNPSLLEQAVVNLIDNAVKYSEPGGAVEIRAGESQGEICIEVEDTGCGISREHLPRLFERFFRVDKARSRKLGGTGLGLAIVKHIVQAHRGSVSVVSVPGQGSTFTLRLPGLSK